MPQTNKKGTRKHLLLLRFSAMGDVAMTVPLVNALSTQYPDLKITIVTRASFKSFFEGIPNVSVYEANFDKHHKGLMGLWRLYKELRDLKVYAVADLHNVLRSKVITFLFKRRGKKTATTDKMRDARKQLTALKDKRFEPIPPVLQRHAAGSGITPVLAIIHSVLINEPESTFVLVYGNKTPEETIFHDQLHELQEKYLGRFFVQFVFSKTHAEGALFGRVDKAAVNFVLKNKHKEKEFAKFYLCGPEEMILLVNDVLKENNVPDKSIKFELFSTPIAEKTIEADLSGQTKVTVLVDDEETTFLMPKEITLLDAALKQGVDAPYSCQGGICSSCMARIKSGSAEMKKNAILTDGEIAEGLILTCQAHPTSAEIYIDFDDV